MGHEIDQLGFPTNPQLKRLENHLAYLAEIWRDTGDNKIVKEYHVTLSLLYDLGWDGVLDYESILAPSIMPKEHMQRNGLDHLLTDV